MLDGGVLGGQSKGVETDGLHDVIAMHALEASVGVKGRVVVPVAHMQIAGWVRKHHEMIEIWFK